MGHSAVSFPLQASYFIATLLLILGLKRMSSPRTARNGIVWAGVGMLLATVVTLAYLPGVWSFAQSGTSWHRLVLILVALAVGAIPAWWTGRRVPLTEMPQMVAIYNGLGGGAAAAIAAVEMYSGRAYLGSLAFPVIAVTGALIGTVAFGGSIVAFLKLQGWMGSPRISGRHILNVILSVLVLALTIANIFPAWAPALRLPVSSLVGIFLVASLILGIF
ncbi:MAG: NAD(P)(+) transhydrogenase (Re/Si-specific) subunit beta, partial [Terriglobia bacterium]